MNAAFYALKWARNIACIPSPTENSVVNFVREGAKRVSGTLTTNRKQPLTTEQLNPIVTKFAKRSGAMKRGYSMCL